MSARQAVDRAAALAILTRPCGRNEALAARLRGWGMQTLLMPALSIEPVQYDPALFPAPGEYDLVIFVSGTAARLYLDQWALSGASGSWPAHTLAATVGRASAESLYAAACFPADGILHPDPDASSHDSEALWAMLEPRAAQFRRVLIVRGQTGREWLGGRLEEAGAQVRRYGVYRRRARCWPAREIGALEDGLARRRPVICLVTSSEGADSIHANLAGRGLDKLWEGIRFVTIHQRIASRLQFLFAPAPEAGLAQRIRVCAPDDTAMAEAIRLAAA